MYIRSIDIKQEESAAMYIRSIDIKPEESAVMYRPWIV